MNRTAVGVAAGVGVVALLALAGRRARTRTIEPPPESLAEAHMWAVLAGDVAA